MLKAFAKLVGLQPSSTIQPNGSIQCGNVCGGTKLYGYVYDEWNCINSSTCSYVGCSCS